MLFWVLILSQGVGWNYKEGVLAMMKRGGLSDVPSIIQRKFIGNEHTFPRCWLRISNNDDGGGLMSDVPSIIQWTQV